MTTQPPRTKPKPPAQPGTAVAPRPPTTEAETVLAELAEQAKSPQDRERAYMLMDAVKQSRLVRSVANVIAATEWGQAMSQARQIAFGRYLLALGADPLRHVDLLGGNPFINGDYFRDVIAANKEFRWPSDPEWIHDDPRLRLCVACDQPFEADTAHAHSNQQVTEENARRLTDRIARAGRRIAENADEESPAICVLVLHYVNCPCAECRRREGPDGVHALSDGSGRGPFKGIGEVHPGQIAKWKDGQKLMVDRDPVGQLSPRGTAETRAWREAGEKAEATWFRTHASTLVQLEGRIATAYEQEKLAGGAAEERREPEPVAQGEEIVVEELPAGAPAVAVAAGPSAPADPTERHHPNAMCSIDGPHPASACGMHRPRGAA
jgi:hypothetical protein